MDSLSSFPRYFTRNVLSLATLALPLAISILAFTACSGDVSQDTTSTGSTGGTGSTGSTGSTGAGGGGSCTTEDPCPTGYACVLPVGSCQKGAKGVCQGLFQCDGPPTGPVCGCDGKTIEGEYPNCAPPIVPTDNAAACQTGTFACGPTLMCKRNSDVCLEKVPGVPATSTFECAPFDSVNATCYGSIPSCDCIKSLGTCMENADHQETVTIVAP
jgi:hypothetical protein